VLNCSVTMMSRPTHNDFRTRLCHSLLPARRRIATFRHSCSPIMSRLSRSSVLADFRNVIPRFTYSPVLADHRMTTWSLTRKLLPVGVQMLIYYLIRNPIMVELHMLVLAIHSSRAITRTSVPIITIIQWIWVEGLMRRARRTGFCLNFVYCRILG